jgi:phospholipid/cholesterol/gamma-HCH transport system substrate-binding protein
VNKIPTDSSASILTAGLLGDNYIGIELGQDTDYLKAGDVITLTSQALLLEELISKFAVGGNNDKGNGGNGNSSGSSNNNNHSNSHESGGSNSNGSSDSSSNGNSSEQQ